MNTSIAQVDIDSDAGASVPAWQRRLHSVRLAGVVIRESTYKRNLGKAIIEMREAVGMNQAQLASAVGRTPAAVSRWETGKADPGGYYLYRIAEACKVPADAVHLLIWPPNPPARPVSKRLRDAREEGARRGLSLVDPQQEGGSAD